MSDILMTGADGVIGTVLRHGLDLPITPFVGDATRYSLLLNQTQGCKAIVHLAWNTKEDNHQSGYADPANFTMAQNVYWAAVTNKVKRVIVASSIHADMPKNEPGGPRSPYRFPEPDSPYGANKVGIEALGHYYALHKGLEVICIRFGWVSPNPAESPDPAGPYPLGEGWLSHRDLNALMHACLTTPGVENNYAIVYGVSLRRGVAVHDTKNRLNWAPMNEYEAKTVRTTDHER